MTTFKQTGSMGTTVDGHPFWKKTFRSGSVYDETPVKSLFVKGLRDHIQSTAQPCWRSHNNADFHTPTAMAMATVDLGGRIKASGSNSEGKCRGKDSTEHQRLRYTVPTIDTSIR